jgi:hypothetical protein
MKDVRVALAQIAIEPLDPKSRLDRMLRASCEVIGGEPDRALGGQYVCVAERRPIFADLRREVDPLDAKAAR